MERRSADGLTDAQGLEAPPQLIADDASGVPKHVAAVLQRALEREQHDRFPVVPSMMAALRSAPLNYNATTANNQRGPMVMPAVAVLPFVNLGGDTRDEYLCDGLSEELIHALAQVRGIRVVSRTASFQFKGHTGDVRTIGSDLAATLLLEGGVRRQSNRLRINVRLIDVATGFERWSERFDRQFEDVFDVQDEIARAIVTSLEGTLQPQAGALVQVATSDMAAYELFLQAKFYWNQRTTDALHRSVELLQRPVALDPVFALAHAALADCCVTLAMYGEDAPHALMPQARVAAEQALRLEAGASQAHTAFICVRGIYDWNWVEAGQQFVLATRSPQASATAFQWFAVNLLVPLGRFAEAHAQLARARAVDPLSAAVTLSVGVTYHSQGNHLAAIREFQVVLAREPQFGMAHYFLARAFTALGRYAEALTATDRAETLLGSSVEPLGARGMILALSGRLHEATAVCTHLDQLATSRYVSPVIVAEILAALGKSDEAIEHLLRAVDLRAADLVWIGARPAFTRIADDARFADIIRTIRIALQTV